MGNVNLNVIVLPGLVAEQRHEVMGAMLLGVYGLWQTANDVRHFAVSRLLDL